MRIRKDSNEMLEDDILTMASISDALAHPVRIRLFRFIMARNKAMKQVCTKDLVDNFDYAQATISQHIKKLVDAGLIVRNKKDQFSYLFVNIGLLSKYIDIVKSFD